MKQPPGGLQPALAGFCVMAESGDVTLGDVVDSLQDAAFTCLALFLMLPFVQPVPLGPYTIATGMVITCLGWQLLQGYPAPVLPPRLRRIRLQPRVLRILLKSCSLCLAFFGRHARPRHAEFVQGPLGHRLKILLMLAAGVLLMAPFPVPLPFNNTLPAIGLLLFCIGELEGDGLMAILALGWMSVTTLLFAAYYVLLWTLGAGAFAQIQEWMGVDVFNL